MPQDQLPIFKQKSFGKVVNQQFIEPVTPTGESSIMQTLPTYQAYLAEKYAPKTVKMYFGDCRELSLYFRDKTLKEITPLDVQQWISTLVSPHGKHLDRKTVNRKVSAVITYFLWLQGTGAITTDPTTLISNARIQSPLPDYLFENEVKLLYQKASSDVRTYFIVLLLLETGMKSNELLTLSKAHVDISDPFTPEVWIKQ